MMGSDSMVLEIVWWGSLRSAPYVRFGHRA